jgi:hypothetical protein
MAIDRCARKEFGFVAAKTRRATITTKTESSYLQKHIVFSASCCAQQLADPVLAIVKPGNSTLLGSQLVLDASA